MTADPTSITHLYRDLLALRHSSRALQLGDLHLFDTPEGVLGYERSAGDGTGSVTVLVNFTNAPVAYDCSGEIAVSSVAARAHGRFDGSLGADEAVVLTR